MKNALFCLLIFLSILKISFSYNSSDPSICTNYSNISDYCEIKDTNIIYNTTTSYLNFSTINIINSIISFNQSTCYTDLCFLIIDSSTVIILTNSAIIYPIIHISVPSLTLSNSNISTNGTIKYNIEESCKDSSEIGVGIGYAGVGAFCQDLTTTCNNPYGSPKFLLNNTKNHTLLLGRGQLQLNGDYFGSGGGRININITDLTLNSKVIISSSGSPQSGDSYNCASRNDKTSFKLLNGGSGGYIYFGVQNILNFGINSDFNIIAEGGNYCEKNDKKTAKFAGSGGRIIIDVLNFKNYFFNKSDLGIKTKISARGGINDFSVSENNINSCRNGPAGSIYIAREDELIFNNFNNQANTLSVIPSEKFKRIIVLNGSRAGPEDNHDNISAEEQIYVYNSYLNYERNYGNLNINTKNLSLVADKAGGIGPPEEDSKNTNLNITAENINFSTNSIVFFGLNFVIISKKLIFSLSNVESYSSQSKFLIYSDLMSLQSSNIEVSQIAITTDSNLEITNSIIRAFKQKCKTEKNYYSYINPNDFKNDFQQLYLITNTSNLFSLMTFLLQNNYTLLILQPPSKNISFITNDTSSTFKIQAANIGIFSLNINITKGYIISSEELGCRNEQGLGSGMQELNLGNKCGGTGGSYGGYGAFAWSNYSDILKDCLKIKNSVLYGDIYNPIYEGSGGGGSQMQLNPGGKGGGVIFLGALDSLIINGIVSSSGSAPETQMGKATAGSGAGGSIQIFMKILNGDGIIKSDGGNSQGSGIGGPGGGGRIRINFIDWFDENGNIFNFTGIVTANPGNRSDFVNLPDEIIYIGKGSIYNNFVIFFIF